MGSPGRERSPRHIRPAHAVAALLGVLLLHPGPAAAQSDAVLDVSVLSADDRTPLQGVRVEVLGTGRWTFTDARGTVRFEGLIPTVVIVRVASIGYEELRRSVTLVPDGVRAVELALTAAPIPIAEVEVAAPPVPTKLIEFYRRMDRGMGHYLTPEEIQRRRAPLFSDLLRGVPGVRINCQLGGCTPVMVRTGHGQRACPVQFFIDGVPVRDFFADNMPARDVEAVEVYRGASQVPPELNRGSASCGVVVIWTRDPSRDR